MRCEVITSRKTNAPGRAAIAEETPTYHTLYLEFVNRPRASFPLVRRQYSDSTANSAYLDLDSRLFLRAWT
jgi:hypothetical protein